MLIKVVDHIREYLSASKIDWKGWIRQVLYPPESQRQLDGWACGLFLMMAMRACIARTGFETVTDDAKEEMRKGALNTLLNLP
jgi:hypothetical protein